MAVNGTTKKRMSISARQGGITDSRECTPYEELYYYPGHAYSPLHDLLPITPPSTRVRPTSHRPATFYTASDTEADEQSDSSGISLAFYTLRKDKQGVWDTLLVVLEAEDGDGRVEEMERNLYPGAILHLPSSLYKSKAHTCISPTPSTASYQNRRITPPLLVPDLQTSMHSGTQLIKLSFRHPAVSSTVAEQARKQGVLGGWTKKEWGRVVRSGEGGIKEWTELIQRRLDDSEGSGSE